MKKSVDFLLITPPFCQTNTPYPATAYLQAYLRKKNQSVVLLDLGIKLLLRIFSASGLHQLFDFAENKYLHHKKNPLLRDLCFIQKNAYIAHISNVMQFLQGKTNQAIPSWIDALPKGRFLHEHIVTDPLADIDIARHKCTLFLEDLSLFIQQYVDPNFGFSRYGEQLGRSANTFDGYAQALEKVPGLLEQWMLELLAQALQECSPRYIGFTLPFPGNLLSALRCAQYLKKNSPKIKIVMGGGFVNTELREIRDERFFQYCDYLCFDHGESTLEQILNDQIRVSSTVLPNRCVLPASPLPFREHAVPDYTGLDLHDYFSVIPISNPMHRLWNDGRWIKMMIAHGCYWGKCSFCDGSLDYIRRYEPLSAETVVNTMVQLMEAQKKALQVAGCSPEENDYNGFHFVDEAAPPVLLRDISLLLLKKGIRVRWWTNIRFEKAFTEDLCQLMAQAGCIAVSGGLEVASPRILKSIGKGVTVEQAFEVCKSFAGAQVLVHAYLMYGFPGQTKKETLESLENVRQLFEKNYIQSAFWHRFALTAHSPMGQNPERFHCIPEHTDFTFAKNDLMFQQTEGDDPEQFTEGLNKALYNYMHGVGFHLPLSHWFR